MLISSLKRTKMFRSKRFSAQQSTSLENELTDPDIEEFDEDSTSCDQAAWTDNVATDVDEILETIDVNGKREIKKGIMTPAHVWTLEEGLKFVVEFNEFQQPVGKGGHILMWFVGDIVKNGSLCPIGESNWHQVNSSYKVEIVKIIRSKFHFPLEPNIDRKLLSHASLKWRTFKYQLKNKYYNPSKTELQLASQVPIELIKEQWVRLVNYWFSPKSKKFSYIGKKARAEKMDRHTSGSRSYAQMRNDFVKKHKREPSNMEFWKVTHLRKDGSFLKNTNAEEFVECASSLVDETLAGSSGKTKIQVEDEVFNTLMYEKDQPNQPLLGYGFGVTRNQVCGLKADLRNMIKFGNTSETSALKVEIQELTKKNERLELLLHRLTSCLVDKGIMDISS